MKETRDILTLFEALSNYEIFTPPKVARSMLDLLPQDVWSNPQLTFLDPCTKSGVFLRECFFRLESGLREQGSIRGKDGLNYNLNDFKQRTTHILKNMLFGISISELTGYVARRTLYGVMEADTDKQIAIIESFERSRNNDEWSEEEKVNFLVRNRFNEYYNHRMFNRPEYAGFESEGNIFFPRDEVKKIVLEQGSFEIEDLYFPFINKDTKHKKILDIRSGNMKFDVIIGNPPYQQEDSGHGRSSRPIYHEFVEQAKSLSPRYLSMIMPSRWFSGGKGLDKFRETMLNDPRVSHIVDFENSRDVFPSVDVAGGVCYFLWDSKHKGNCRITNKSKSDENTQERPLNDFHILVRNNKSVEIINKIKATHDGHYMDKVISPRNPFGITAKTKPEEKGTPCWFTKKIGKSFVKSSMVAENQYKDRWKVLLPYAPIAGQTDFSKPVKFFHSQNVIIASPGDVCVETYLVANHFDSQAEALSFKSYLFSKVFRFLLLQNVVSQHITRGCYCFVPDIEDYSRQYSDEVLCEQWGITNSEWNLINSRILDTE